MAQKGSSVLLLVVSCLTICFAYHLTPQHDPVQRQDEAEEEATTLPTNGHLIGTLAGVLSSILRSGPNGTSPINFNLTAALQRLTRLQLFPTFPFPLFPNLPKEEQTALSTIQSTPLTPPLKSARKRLNYRNPSRKPAFEIRNEIREPPTNQEEDDDQKGSIRVAGPETTPAQERCRNCNQEVGIRKVPPSGQQYVAPDSFPIYRVATTTDEADFEVAEEEVKEQEPVTEVPQRRTPEPTPEPEPTIPVTSYPRLPVYTTEQTLDLRQVDIAGMAYWVMAYLNPALKLAKDATRNVTVTGVVNGTAQGVKGFVTAIPSFAETISELVDFFEEF